MSEADNIAVVRIFCSLPLSPCIIVNFSLLMHDSFLSQSFLVLASELTVIKFT
jgi:hypothetical protein